MKPEIVNAEVEANGQLTAYCKAPASFPTMAIRFFVYGELVDENKLGRRDIWQNVSKEEDGRQTIMKQVRLRLASGQIVNDNVEIACDATLYDKYYAIVVEAVNASSVAARSGLCQNNGVVIGLSVFFSLIFVVVFIVVVWCVCKKEKRPARSAVHFINKGAVDVNKTAIVKSDDLTADEISAAP